MTPPPTLAVVVAVLLLNAHVRAIPAKNLNALSLSSSLEDMVIEFLRQCIEEFNKLLGDGCVKELDPWEATSDVHCEDRDEETRLSYNVNASNMKSLNLSSMELMAGGNFNGGHDMIFDVEMPLLDISGVYTASGSLSFLHFFYGDGSFTMYLYQVRTRCTVHYDDQTEIFSVDPEKMEPLRFQSLAVRFENLLGLNSNSDREKISVVMANAIYEKVQEQIKMQFSQVLTEYLNEQNSPWWWPGRSD